jgi:hypothetical protein
MNAADDNREMKILESKGILIKDQPYHVVLTNRRIILTSYADNKPRSIAIREIQKTELGSDDSRDPVIIIFLPSAAGETKKVILHFSQKNFPDPQQVSSLWSSEINKTIASPVPVSPDIIPKKVSGAPAFCVKCGTKFTDGSVFCNKCGTKILYPAQPLPLDQSDASIQQKVTTQKISPIPGEPSPKKASSPIAGDSNTKEKIPLLEPMHKEPRKQKFSIVGSGTRKPAVLVVSALMGVIVLIAVFFVVVPSASHGFEFNIPGTDLISPEVTVTMSATSHVATTPTISQTPSRLTITPTISKTTSTPATPVRTTAISVQTSTPVRTPTPVQTGIPQVVIVQPSFNRTPGDPWSVFVTYPSLFNAGNSAGIYSLLSDNMKSHYPDASLKNELATARSNGYFIEKIQANDQIIEEDSAILEVEIAWKISGSTQTSTPRVFLLYENNQWKLDSLIVSPAS